MAPVDQDQFHDIHHKIFQDLFPPLDQIADEEHTAYTGQLSEHDLLPEDMDPFVRHTQKLMSSLQFQHPCS